MTDETNDTESSQTPSAVEEESETRSFDSINKVTPVSKYLAMVLFILMPIIGGWIGYNYGPEKVVEVEKFNVVDKLNSFDASTEEALLNLPPLPEELNWIEVDEFESESFEVSFSDYKSINGHIAVTGKLYHATYTVQSYSDEDYSYYIDDLKRTQGWTEQTEINTITYTGASADGPTGGQHAIIKEFDGKMMTLVFVDQLDRACFVASKSGPIKATFPCERTNKIFVSDLFDLIEVDSDLKTYRNEEYGFELRLPKSFNNVRIVEKKFTEFYNITNISFEMKRIELNEYSTVCHIQIMPKDDWATRQTDEDPGKPIYLDETDTLVYGWGCGHEDAGYEGFVEYNSAREKCALGEGECESQVGPYDEFKEALESFKLIDSESDLKTYRNEEYGFEFEYPENRELVVGNTAFEYAPSFYLQPNQPYSMFIAPKGEFDRGLPFEEPIVKENRIYGDNSLLWVEYESEDAYWISVYFSDWHKNNRIEFNLTKNDDEENSRNEIESILESFNIFEAQDVSNWKTYRNEEYGFEFRYPEYYDVYGLTRGSDEVFHTPPREGDDVIFARNYESTLVTPGQGFKIYVNPIVEETDWLQVWEDNSRDIVSYRHSYSQFLGTTTFKGDTVGLVKSCDLGGCEELIEVPTEKYLFKIEISSDQDGRYDSDQEIKNTFVRERMVESFKFIE